MRFTGNMLRAVLLLLIVVQNASAITGLDTIAPLTRAVCEIFGKLIPFSIALMMLSYAALLWVYSREDPAMRERAKKMFVWVFAALVIVNISKPLIMTIFKDVTDLCPE